SLLQEPGAVASPALKRTGMRPVPWTQAGKREDATMKIPGMKYGAEFCAGRSAGLVIAGLLAAGALSGWGISATFGTRAAAIEAPFELTRNRDMATVEGVKASLVGSYLVTGTDSDGKP